MAEAIWLVSPERSWKMDRDRSVGSSRMRSLTRLRAAAATTKSSSFTIEISRGRHETRVDTKTGLRFAPWERPLVLESRLSRADSVGEVLVGVTSGLGTGDGLGESAPCIESLDVEPGRSSCKLGNNDMGVLIHCIFGSTCLSSCAQPISESLRRSSIGITWPLLSVNSFGSSSRTKAFVPISVGTKRIGGLANLKGLR